MTPYVRTTLASATSAVRRCDHRWLHLHATHVDVPAPAASSHAPAVHGSVAPVTVPPEIMGTRPPEAPTRKRVIPWWARSGF